VSLWSQWKVPASAFITPAAPVFWGWWQGWRVSAASREVSPERRAPFPAVRCLGPSGPERRRA